MELQSESSLTILVANIKIKKSHLNMREDLDRLWDDAVVKHVPTTAIWSCRSQGSEIRPKNNLKG